MRMRLHLHRFAAVAALLSAAGCATHTPPQDAPPALPERWAQAPATGADGIAADWWSAFGSAELDALVRQAAEGSHDLAAAVARVQQAEAAARAAGAALWPSLTAGVSAGREARLGGHADVAGTAFGASLQMRYEADFWGRHRAARDGGEALLQASRHDRDTLRLALAAGVAGAWLQAVALHERIDLGALNLQTAERLLAVVEARARAGAASLLELAQQRGLVAAQRRSLAALREQAHAAHMALALLLGRAEGAPLAQVRSLAALRAPALQPGTPAALLARRPDIARAEAQLAAADADVAAARAALLPALTLSADLASGASRWRQVLDNPAYTLAAALAAPILDGGRLAAVRDAAQARREELLAGYRQTVVAAFVDVETALGAMTELDAQRQAQADELRQAQRALALAERRYRAGAESLLTLLDAQRTLYAAQDLAAQLQARRLQASVDLYRALGGGWRLQDEEEAAS